MCILPTIVYESALTAVLSVSVLTSFGKLITSEVFSILLATVLLILASYLTLMSASHKKWLSYLALITQLNDYQGTLEPLINVNRAREDALAFISFGQLTRNALLIFMLVNIMPETQATGRGTVTIAYGIYELVMPMIMCLAICLPTTLIIKQQHRYQRLQENFSHFDISIFAFTPLFAYLVAESFSCSGLNTLICVGLFHNLYTRKNLENQKFRIVAQSINFCSYQLKQIGLLITGVLLVILMTK